MSIADDLLRVAPFEATPLDAYRLVATLVTKRIGEMDAEVWNPRLSPRRYVRLRAKRAAFVEVQTILEALVRRQTDPPTPTSRPPALTAPKGTYGSG